MTIPNPDLDEFYQKWSAKSDSQIQADINSSLRKAETIAARLPKETLSQIKTMLDFGCGYGAFIDRFAKVIGVNWAGGVDFSCDAIRVAQTRYQSDALQFRKLSSLRIADNIEEIRRLIPGKVDCISLIDLLEHVPDCKTTVMSLAPLCSYFVIKLPVESAVLDNYLLPKEYPSALHSNGHFREFDANNVFYFIRKLGLTPIYETLYVYHINDTLPPLPAGSSIKRSLVHGVIKIVKRVGAAVLPTKIFLRLVGGGGYFCIATFNPEHMLVP